MHKRGGMRGNGWGLFVVVTVGDGGVNVRDKKVGMGSSDTGCTCVGRSCCGCFVRGAYIFMKTSASYLSAAC